MRDRARVACPCRARMHAHVSIMRLPFVCLPKNQPGVFRRWRVGVAEAAGAGVSPPAARSRLRLSCGVALFAVCAPCGALYFFCVSVHIGAGKSARVPALAFLCGYCRSLSSALFVFRLGNLFRDREGRRQAAPGGGSFLYRGEVFNTARRSVRTSEHVSARA